MNESDERKFDKKNSDTKKKICSLKTIDNQRKDGG